MKLTRRGALIGAGAAAVAALPTAVDAAAREAVQLFGQLNPRRQKVSLMAMRMFLEVQCHNESKGFVTEEAARAAIEASYKTRRMQP